VLDLAVLESGLLTVHSTDLVDIRRVTEEIVQVCAATAATDVDVLLRVDADVPTFVKSDRVRLQQVPNRCFVCCRVS
jgi:hypothetical protein